MQFLEHVYVQVYVVVYGVHRYRVGSPKIGGLLGLPRYNGS